MPPRSTVPAVALALGSSWKEFTGNATFTDRHGRVAHVKGGDTVMDIAADILFHFDF
jgi:hypothetical protein